MPKAKKRPGQAQGHAVPAEPPSLAASLFGNAVSSAGGVLSLPDTWQPTTHEPKPAAKKTAQLSRRQLAAQQAAEDKGSLRAANDSDGGSESEAVPAGVNPGWKSLMAEEVSAGRGLERQGKSAKEIRAGRSATVEQRTVFVGNLPLSFTKKKRPLKQLFKTCGEVESIRFRSFAVADLKMPRKGAFITQNFNPARDSCNAYVVFKSDDPCVIASALALNNHELEGRHIRVDKAAQRKADSKHSVFVGNLPFDVDEEELRAHFAIECGIEGIVNVRIVRDPKTSLGKGIGFVQLETEAATAAALEVHGTKFNPKAESGGGEVRKLRVFKASAKAAAAAHKGGHDRFGHSVRYKTTALRFVTVSNFLTLCRMLVLLRA